MTRGADRNAPASGLTQDQIDKLLTSPFVQQTPQVTIDLTGSTPFQTNDFFDVTFTDGPADVSLTKLTIDLSPANAFFDPTDAPPGNAGSGLGTSGLVGINASDLSFSGLIDGSQLLTVDIAPGAFTKGDHLAFGSDIDLFSAIDFFGATPAELVGIKFGFEFDIGLSLSTELDADLVTSSIDVTTINNFVGSPAPFGPQVPANQLPPGSSQPIASHPFAYNFGGQVPTPPTIWMLLFAAGVYRCRRNT